MSQQQQQQQQQCPYCGVVHRKESARLRCVQTQGQDSMMYKRKKLLSQISPVQPQLDPRVHSEDESQRVEAVYDGGSREWDMLMKDKSPKVRQAVAGQNYKPDILGKDKDESVRQVALGEITLDDINVEEEV